MKTIIIAITLMLSSSIFAQSDSEVTVGAIWKVEVVEYDNKNKEVDHWYSNSACAWDFDLAKDSITFTEYALPSGEIKKQHTELVQSSTINDEVATLVIQNKAGATYNAMFWTDFSMVVYEFSDGYVIMTPEED
tara:strand:+ start:1598 stop:1999 length:402 start_codon:yes stop_codon:yes gene_type:complete